MNEKRMNGYLLAGMIITGVLTAMIVLGYFWTPYDPTAMGVGPKLSGPTLQNLMGTDNFGRDIFSRVMKGAGTTFAIAVATVAIGTVFGTLLGALTGYFGGLADMILMRLGDVLTAFPNRDVNYIKSARLMGASSSRILWVHILPNTMQILLPAITIGFNNAVLAEASMSYLGIGVTPPDASLGYMLSEAQGMFSAAPWYALGTGLIMVLLIFGVGLIGEGLQRRSGEVD